MTRVHRSIPIHVCCATKPIDLCCSINSLVLIKTLIHYKTVWLFAVCSKFKTALSLDRFFLSAARAGKSTPQDCCHQRNPLIFCPANHALQIYLSCAADLSYPVGDPDSFSSPYWRTLQPQACGGTAPMHQNAKGGNCEKSWSTTHEDTMMRNVPQPNAPSHFSPPW